MSVEFKDFSARLKTVCNEVGNVWLNKWGNSIASKAKDTSQLDGDAGVELRKSYRAEVNTGKGEAIVGTPLEQGYWEEYGTGEHAVREPHRRGWWVYSDDYEGNGGKILKEAQAKAIAASSGGELHATDGRDPHYTLENAFKTLSPRAQADLQRMMKERFGK